MFYVATKQDAGFDLVGRIQHFFEDAFAAFAQRREYTHTYKELSRLTNNELADIGIRRCDIHDIANR